jgi:hypothetical protein
MPQKKFDYFKLMAENQEKSNLMKKEELKDALMTVGAMALPCPQ